MTISALKLYRYETCGLAGWISAIGHGAALQTCAVTLLRCARWTRGLFKIVRARVLVNRFPRYRRRWRGCLIRYIWRYPAINRLAETFNIVWRNKNRNFLPCTIKNQHCKTVKTRSVQTLLRDVYGEHFLAGTLRIDITHNIARPRRRHRQEAHHAKF